VTVQDRFPQRRPTAEHQELTREHNSNRAIDAGHRECSLKEEFRQL